MDALSKVGGFIRGIPSSIASLFAFYPPPPSYEIRHHPTDESVAEIAFGEEVGSVREEEMARMEARLAKTERGTSIVTLFVRSSKDPKQTIMFSHGNAEDLGLKIDFLLELSDETNSNVFSYDYSGYGRSTGKPSEENLYADIKAAWDVLRSRHGIPEENIVLYGRSLGSVPTVRLASERENLPGVILHSPLSSALGMVLRFTPWSVGPFAVTDLVPRITCPVLVVHGTQDEVIPNSHGRFIHERCQQKVEPLWVEGAGHNNVEAYPQFWRRLKRFLEQELRVGRKETSPKFPHDGKGSTSWHKI
ncbi:unnamed protein product [Darwinula stevensoni]|uniref:Serine aminopeptidase S33 domain-containing protein n=1 Tax=Darwinula stevensoni TaxID=69355 RepID=A0A7R8XI96_9CRUS|nr:unnamed protein product [Darwinula stevensoni]CAG0893636.1 unnamed protein product [Darwinula stevensoni]